jgi:hypothetical protein
VALSKKSQKKPEDASINLPRHERRLPLVSSPRLHRLSFCTELGRAIVLYSEPMPRPLQAFLGQRAPAKIKNTHAISAVIEIFTTQQIREINDALQDI